MTYRDNCNKRVDEKIGKRDELEFAFHTIQRSAVRCRDNDLDARLCRIYACTRVTCTEHLEKHEKLSIVCLNECMNERSRANAREKNDRDASTVQSLI